MTLTRALAERAARTVQDEGPAPGSVQLAEEDYELAVREILAQAPPEGIWLFAYGSLLWKPECELGESRSALVRGWHRAYCIRMLRFRGTLERPGLMMSLDRGGRCRGMVFRLCDDVRGSLHKLLRRELVIKPPPQRVHWLAAETADGTVRAIAFVANRPSDRYVGKLAQDDIADVVATAAGSWGSCAQYLHETVARLEELGIHDRNLWRLQQLVAERLQAADTSIS
jgi:cation transport protein ChaC